MEYRLMNSPEKLSRVIISGQKGECEQTWEIGQIIEDKYEIEEVIAKDEHKIIHKVRHFQWNISLAVRSQLDQESQVQFFHQAERWVQLGKHPNVVSAYYVQNIGGIPRLFVEYVKARTLRDFIYSEDYDVATSLDIAIQICWGMDHAHRKGLLHGDLRSANLFISDKGQVKVTDFRSREGMLLEYTPYMAPEQFEDDWVAVPAIDIYSFGVILYELCVKELPFKPESDIEMKEWAQNFGNMILTQQPPVPHKVNPKIPSSLSDLVLQCISVNAEDRPRYFEDIVERLQKIYMEMTIFQYPRKAPDSATLAAVDLNNRALSLLDLKQEEEAEEHLQEAVAASSQCTGPLINLHLFRLRMGKGSLARLRKATEPLLRSDREVATFYRGKISLERGGFLKNALADMEAPDIDFSQNKDLLRLKALLLKRLNEYARAIEIFEKMLSMESSSLQDIYCLAVCFLEQGKKKKAIEILEKGKTLYPDNPYLMLATGVAVAMRGRLEESYGLFQQVAKSDSEDFWALLNLAEITAAFGDYIKPYKRATPAVLEAKKLYEKLVEKAPRLSRVTRGYRFVFGQSPPMREHSKEEILPRWSYTRSIEGYSEGIHCMALSPDGRMALIGGEDPQLQLWEIGTGKSRNRLQGHSDGTSQVTISHDGHFAVSRGRDNIIMVWDLITGECVKKLEGHVRDVTSFALTTTGYLVSGSLDRTLRIWDFGALSCRRILKGHEDKINCVAVTPCGSLAISGSEDRRIGIWDIERGSPIDFLKGHTEGVTNVVVSPDGRYLVSGGWDQQIRVYELETRECVAVLKGHTGTLNCIEITPDSEMVISGSEDKTIRVWEIASGKCVYTLTGHTVDVTCIAVAPHSRFMVSGSWDHSLRVWDLTSGQCLAFLEEHTDLVHTVAITPDERFILSGGDDAGLKVWCDLSTQSCPEFEESALSYLLQRPPTQHGNLEGQRKVEKLIVLAEEKQREEKPAEAMSIYREIQEIEGFNRNHRVLGSIYRTARESGLKHNRLRSVWQHKVLCGHGDAITCVTIFSKKNIAISGSKDHTLKVWDIESGHCLDTLEGHEGPIACIDIIPNGRFAVSSSYDKTLRLWELETGRCIYKMEGHKHWVEYTKFTPDGRRIISASRDNNIRIWERKTGHRLYSLTSHTDLISALAITSDANFLISGSHDRTIRVWELESGHCVHCLEKHKEHIKCIACVPDSSLILSGGWDCDIYLWDIEKGECVETFSGHQSWIDEICVTRDGKRAISCGLDKTIRVWEIETGKCLAVLTGHEQDVNHVTVSDSGNFCVSSSWDNTLRVWDLRNYQCCDVLKGHSDMITALRADREHRYMLTGSKDKNVIIWEFDWNWE